MTTFTRCPLGRRASTMGLLSSTRLPKGASIRSINERNCVAFTKSAPWNSTTPKRSTKTALVPFTMISVTSRSSTRDCSGPRPKTVSTSSFASCSFVSPERAAHFAVENTDRMALFSSLRALFGLSTANDASVSPAMIAPTSSFNSSSIQAFASETNRPLSAWADPTLSISVI